MCVWDISVDFACICMYMYVCMHACMYVEGLSLIECWGCGCVYCVCARATASLSVCVVCVCERESTPVCGYIVCVHAWGLGFRVALGLKPQGSGHVPAEKHAEEHEEPPDGACLFLDYGPVCRW